MVALLRPPVGSAAGRPRRLQLVVDNTSSPAGSRRSGRTAEAPFAPLDVPMIVGVAVAALVVLGGLLFVRVAQGTAPADSWEGVGSAASASSTAAPSGVIGSGVVDPNAQFVIAKPGDSLWSLAQELAPNSDPRPVVAALIEANGGESLQIGQQIVIPQQLLD